MTVGQVIDAWYVRMSDSKPSNERGNQVTMRERHPKRGDRSGWLAVMKGAISKNASYFNSHRMMRRYATEAYLR